MDRPIVMFGPGIYIIDRPIYLSGPGNFNGMGVIIYPSIHFTGEYLLEVFGTDMTFDNFTMYGHCRYWWQRLFFKKKIGCIRFSCKEQDNG